ncbi:MAG: hypothetical protein F9K23_00600 [Bacteroidetes bacterium]|nr:MAG: hypothetical protein F9K23_00600 [Bacteroidota bacterium]
MKIAMAVLFALGILSYGCSKKKSALSPYVLNMEVFGAKVVDSTAIPPEIKYEGNIVVAIEWQDKLGKNLFIGSLTGEKTGIIIDSLYRDGFELSDRKLYCYHFVSNSLKPNWEIKKDENCVYDLGVNFIEKTISVTDLDKDSIGEVSFAYYSACRSDVSPSDVEVILEENKVFYKLSGIGLLPHGRKNKDEILDKEDICCLDKVGEKDFDNQLGKYKDEVSFVNAPPSFLDFAQSVWVSAIHNEYNYLK